MNTRKSYFDKMLHDRSNCVIGCSICININRKELEKLISKKRKD